MELTFLFHQLGVASAVQERNELLHATWQAEFEDIPAEYCVWLDEVSIDDRMNQHQNRWSPVGQACVGQIQTPWHDQNVMA